MHAAWLKTLITKITITITIAVTNTIVVVMHQAGLTCGLDQEVIVDAAMLVVMSNGRPVRRHELRFAQSPAFQDASVMQQHVRHLKHRRRMCAVVVWIGRGVPTLHLLQEVDQLDFVQLEVSDEACLLVQMEAQQRQALTLALLSKAKDVKLPIVACILQHTNRQPIAG